MNNFEFNPPKLHNFVSQIAKKIVNGKRSN